jgi:MFS family permease
MSYSISERFRATELNGAAALATVAALVCVIFMGSTLATPLYVLYARAFGFSPITLTLVYAIYVVGNVVALLFLGRLSDMIGRRHVGLMALAVAGLSTVLFLLAKTTAWLFVARALSGFAVGLAAAAATAWLVELVADDDRSRATLIATSSNFLGLAIGSLLSGMLAQYAPWPLHLIFVFYLAMLLMVAILIALTHETVARGGRSLNHISFRPRLGVPPSIRVPFIAPAVTLFGTMALVGFYAALLPSLLTEILHETSRAIAGAVVFELALVVAVAILATHRLASRTAMLIGLALLLPSLAALVLAEALGSMPILLTGTALSGISAALGYRGSLQVVNQIAPADRKAEVVSSYFVAGFIGNAVPVIGVGVISHVSNLTIASLAFALTIAVFAIAALFVGLKYAKD